MNKQTLIHYILDILMIIILLTLMAYMLTGQKNHEWLGIAAFILFALHNLFNLKWFCRLNKGKYTSLRILRTALVFLLLMLIVIQTISGIAMSRHIFSFLELPLTTSFVRLLHLCFGYWLFVLIGLHLGIHWAIFLSLGRKLLGKAAIRARRWFLWLTAITSASYGLFCFLEQNIPDYLFLRTHFAFFDYEQSFFLYIAELMSILSFWVLAGYLIQKLIQRKNSFPKNEMK